MRTALITGASSGFGLLTSVTLAKRGWRVLATMRDLNRREKLEAAARNAGVLEQIDFHALDIKNPQQIAAIADLIAGRGEPLHALVNNAGFAVPGFAEDITDAELREQIRHQLLRVGRHHACAAAANAPARFWARSNGLIDLGKAGLSRRQQLCGFEICPRRMDRNVAL